MPKRGKKYIKCLEKKQDKVFNLDDAIKEVKKTSYSSFTGSIELHIALKKTKDKDPSSVKGSVSLPYSESKKITIAVFTTPENEKKAKDAGADLVGTEDLMKEVKKGNVKFDIAIAEPSIMPQIAQIGKELGPKGLMPNPKTGTVTEDFVSAISEYKKGKTNFAADKNSVIHIAVGKTDLDDEKIKENILEVFKAIENAFNKKELNLISKSIHLAPTMGTSVKLEFSN